MFDRTTLLSPSPDLNPIKSPWTVLKKMSLPGPQDFVVTEHCVHDIKEKEMWELLECRNAAYIKFTSVLKLSKLFIFGFLHMGYKQIKTLSPTTLSDFVNIFY